MTVTEAAGRAGVIGFAVTEAGRGTGTGPGVDALPPAPTVLHPAAGEGVCEVYSKH